MGIYYSIDGINWSQTNQTTGQFYCLLHNDNKYFAGNQSGIYYSTDGGMTWQ
jgi:photosystem II stability/assembly factor-like uncharacterized protein